MSQIPEVLSNFEIYIAAAKRSSGVADVTLPEAAQKVATVSGAGIGGEIEVPVIGHFQAMSATINFRTLNEDTALAMLSVGNIVTAMGSIQAYDSKTGITKQVPVKVLMRGRGKTASLGTLQSGEAMGNSVEFSVDYLHIFYNNKPMIEVDPYNMVYRVMGVDQLKDLRKNIGR